ncbi:MAG: methyltransferase regulatory domain-containing protein [Candidimonas sp.]|nr:methyltransferase regulatory domain-containing protein [Candidimonas sp.]
MNASSIFADSATDGSSSRPRLSKPVPSSAPGHLRAVAHLYGIETPPLGNARVLELGCETGGNLLPFALAHPNAQIVGIDLWPENVLDAREIARELGAANLTFHNRLYTEIDKGLGLFDYIIVHDQFTWASSATREAIFRICCENLAPLGIAYISYNTYPGWKAGDTLRDAMQLHNHSASSMEEMISGAAAMLHFMSEGVAGRNTQAAQLKAAVDKISKRPAHYINKEFLHSTTAAFYFIEFAEAAAQAGLAYVGDARPEREIAATYGANVQLNQSLVAFGQPKVMRQQYLDFAVDREFRGSLLVHQERADNFLNTPDLSRSTDLHWAGSLKRETFTTSPGKTTTFSDAQGAVFSIQDETAIRICETLAGVWPMTLTHEQLVAAVKDAEAWLQPDKGQAAADDIQHALEALLKMGAVEYRLDAGPYNGFKNNTLYLLASVRDFLEFDDSTQNILIGFNLWHKAVRLHLTPAQTHLLPNIDGKQCTDQLLAVASQVGNSESVQLDAVTRNSKADIKKKDSITALAQMIDALRMQGVLGGSSHAWRDHFKTMLSTDFLPSEHRLEYLILYLQYVRQADQQSLKVSPSDANRQAKSGGVTGFAIQKPEIIRAFNRIQALRRQRKFWEAEPIARQLTTTNQDEAVGWHLLGILLAEMGNVADCVSPLLKALALQPANMAVYTDLSVALQLLKERQHAEAVLRYALEIEHRYLPNWLNLGNLFKDQNKPMLAEICCLNALSIEKDNTNALINLATVLAEQGRLEESVGFLRKAITIQPDNHVAHSNLLFMLSQHADISERDLYEEHRAFGKQVERTNKKHAVMLQHKNIRDLNRPLRIGFVSGDLCNHAVANFVEPVWPAFNKLEFELYAYDNTPSEDAVTQRLKVHIKAWRKIRPLSDLDLAKVINQDRIDILVDLSGHTAHNRLPMFALKPAPIQISWIGYPGTTGLKAMDYYLVNSYQVPRGLLDEQFTEKLIRVPATASFEPFPHSPDVNRLPALAASCFTFASFNRISKINETMLKAWVNILEQTRGSRLLLGHVYPEITEELKDKFQAYGISQERVVFQPRTSMEEYLALHHQVDLLLDTFPYNGGTTTLHGLWMGVPTVTLAGNSMPSRTGVTIMGTVDLAEFITNTHSDYISTAVRWASDLERLAAIRASLRDRLRDSSFLSPVLTVESIEWAMRHAWVQWCNGKKVETFERSSDKAERAV